MHLLDTLGISISYIFPSFIPVNCYYSRAPIPEQEFAIPPAVRPLPFNFFIDSNFPNQNTHQTDEQILECILNKQYKYITKGRMRSNTSKSIGNSNVLFFQFYFSQISNHCRSSNRVLS